MRIMAIDYGDARIGLAVSDPGGTLAGEAWIIEERNFEKAALQVVQEAKSRGVVRLVLGDPKNMDGTRGFRAEKTDKFAALLTDLSDMPVILWDERRTTVGAEAILRAAGRRGRKKKKVLDAVAASLILESYLNYLK